MPAIVGRTDALIQGLASVGAGYSAELHADASSRPRLRASLATRGQSPFKFGDPMLIMVEQRLDHRPHHGKATNWTVKIESNAMAEHQWYYMSADFLGNSQMVGPITETELLGLIRQGKVTMQTQLMSPSRTKSSWYTVQQMPGMKRAVEQIAEEQCEAKQKEADERARQRQLAVTARQTEIDRLRAHAAQISDSQNVALIGAIMERVQSILTTHENVEFIAVQEKPVMNISPDAIVATNRRLIFYRPKLLGRFEFQDYLWFDLHNAHFQKNLLGATFWAQHMSGQMVTMDYLPLTAAQTLYRMAQEREEQARLRRHEMHLDTLRAGAANVNVQTNVMSPPVTAEIIPARATITAVHPAIEQSSSSDDLTRRLRKLKDMLDQGLITEEDFERRKREILAQV